MLSIDIHSTQHRKNKIMQPSAWLMMVEKMEIEKAMKEINVKVNWIDE